MEPYVVAADVYSTPPHVGREGWTWYTGSAGWMYRAGIEGILGLTRMGQTLCLNPTLPGSWPEATIKIALGAAQYTITIRNPDGGMTKPRMALLDGIDVPVTQEGLKIELKDGLHQVLVILGA